MLWWKRSECHEQNVLGDLLKVGDRYKGVLKGLSEMKLKQENDSQEGDGEGTGTGNTHVNPLEEVISLAC